MPIVDGGPIHFTLPRHLFFPAFSEKTDINTEINSFFNNLQAAGKIANYTLTLTQGQIQVSAALPSIVPANPSEAEKSASSDTTAN
jgi:hypothetical protein